MACGCGGRKSYAAVVRNGTPAPQASPFMGGMMSTNDACTQDNTVKIRYNGPTGNHLVASPLRKFTSYGMHTNGDIFCVHVDDQATVPQVFVKIKEEQPAEPVVVEPEPAMTAAVATEVVVEENKAPARRKKEK